MSERSRTQDILVDILGVQNTINTYLGLINAGLGEGGSIVATSNNNIDLAGRPVERTIYVDSSAPAGGDGLSRETAFRTVEEGLDLADTSNGLDLILIFDDPGLDGYDINRNDANSTWASNVVIIGMGREQVRIVNSFEGVTHVLGFEGCSVYMSNIKLWTGDEPYIQYLLALDGCNGSEIENCDFYLLNAGDMSFGINLEDTSRAKVENSHFYFEWDKGDDAAYSNGIWINGSHQNEINRCIFDGAHISVPGGTGIKVDTSSRQNIFRENNFIENTIAIDLDQTTENNFAMRNNYAGCAADFSDDSGDNYEVCACTTAEL